jgi:hypothetical protein
MNTIVLPGIAVTLPPKLENQPFWGWPYSAIPGSDSSNSLQLDSIGNIDPNWELPRGLRSPWDDATLNGYIVPGKVRIKHSKAVRHDKKQQPGVHNGTLTIHGFDLAVMQLRCWLWTEAQWDAYQELTHGLYNLLYTAILEQDTTGASAAVDIQYPALAVVGISKVVVVNFNLPEESGTPGVMEAGFSMVEYNPAKAGSPQNIIGSAPRLSTVQNAFNKPTTKVPPDQGTGANP